MGENCGTSTKSPSLFGMIPTAENGRDLRSNLEGRSILFLNKYPTKYNCRYFSGRKERKVVGIHRSRTQLRREIVSFVSFDGGKNVWCARAPKILA